MNKFFTAILLILVTNTIFAQSSSPAQLKKELAAPDSETGSKVVIVENADITRQLNRIDSDIKKSVEGFRVMIFFDNKQQARSNAESVLGQFRASYPDIPGYLIYKNPEFKVIVGDCLTPDEAVIVWGRVKKDFPNAVITRENLPLAQMLRGSN